MSVSSTFQWFGDRVTDAVFGDITMRLNQGGAAWLAESRALAPVKTGRLRAEEGYRVEGRTLVLLMGAPYDIFQEFGTRTIHPHPHVRPAMAAIGRIFGSSIEMNFNVPSIVSPVIAHEGRMIIPSAIQPRPLTQAQHRRVQANQAVSQRLHKGNVKRARMVVRRFD